MTYYVWYRILHRHLGSPTRWMKLGRPYYSQASANIAVASRARMSGSSVEYLVLEEGVQP